MSEAGTGVRSDGEARKEVGTVLAFVLEGTERDEIMRQLHMAAAYEGGRLREETVTTRPAGDELISGQKVSLAGQGFVVYAAEMER